MIFTSYGLLASLSLGLLLAAAGLWYRREKISVHVWLQLCIAAIPLALVGSRLLFSVSAIINGDFSSPVQALYAWDGGASITGAFVAMVQAMKKLKADGLIQEVPITSFLSAISVGKVADQLMLDLCYEEDSRAQVDMNVIMTDDGRFVELQGTGEEAPFTAEEMVGLVALAKKGCEELCKAQKEIIGEL